MAWLPEGPACSPVCPSSVPSNPRGRVGTWRLAQPPGNFLEDISVPRLPRGLDPQLFVNHRNSEKGSAVQAWAQQKSLGPWWPRRQDWPRALALRWDAGHPAGRRLAEPRELCSHPVQRPQSVSLPHHCGRLAPTSQGGCARPSQPQASPGGTRMGPFCGSCPS